MHRSIVVPVALALLTSACSDTVAPAATSHRPNQAGVSEGPLWEAVEFPEGSTVVGLNNAGQVVGHVGDAGFLWQDGTSTPLPFRPLKLNERGQVVGELPGSCCDPPMFVLWEAGTIQPIEIDTDRVFGFQYFVRALSEEGDVSGTAFSGGPFIVGWKWSKGVFSPLPGHPDTGGEVSVGGINNRGWTSGTSATYEARDEVGTLWRDTVPEALPFLDPTDNISSARGINARGDVVGTSGQFVQDPERIPGHCCVTRNRAVVWRSGLAIDLGAYPGASTFGSLLNERGQVAGIASLPTGGVVFLWTDGVVREMETPSFATDFSLVAMNGRGDILAGSFLPWWTGDPVVVWVDAQAHDLGLGAPIAINNAGDVLLQRGQPTRGVLLRRVR
jgi:uncharacterized membrane protein